MGKFEPSGVTRHDPSDASFRTSQTCYFDGSGVQRSVTRGIEHL